MKFSIILPVANQAEHLESMLTEMVAVMRGHEPGFELVIVVNGSTDDSLEIAQQLAQKHPEIQVTQSERGWGNAVIHGLGEATGEFLCFTNSARTQPADLLRALEYVVIDPNAVAKASRQTRDSFARRAGSVLYNLELRILFHVAIWDVNGTPKAFHRSLLPQLALTERGDLLDAQLAINCRRNAIPIVEFSVYDTSRRSGVSTTRLASAKRMYVGILQMWIGARISRDSDPLSQFVSRLRHLARAASRSGPDSDAA